MTSDLDIYRTANVLVKRHGPTEPEPRPRGGAFLLRLIALSYAPRIILLYAISAMIEIVIERWINAEGQTDSRWSVWSDGYRIQMGPSPLLSGCLLPLEV